MPVCIDIWICANKELKQKNVIVTCLKDVLNEICCWVGRIDHVRYNCYTQLTPLTNERLKCISILWSCRDRKGELLSSLLTNTTNKRPSILIKELTRFCLIEGRCLWYVTR